MQVQEVYTADKIFTGEQWLTGQALILDKHLIKDIIPVSEIPSQAAVRQFPDGIIAPAFIDLQIYGAHGRLFSVYPEADSLNKLNNYCRAGSAAYCLPTVATNSYGVFQRCIDAVRDYWHRDGKGILGVHLEGPWINPSKRGAHIESYIHTPSVQQVNDLLEYGAGIIKMVTLAPEMCSGETIDLLNSKNIVVSAGHSNASYEEARNSFRKWIKAVTHLYNAMSPLQHRAPGLVGASMDDHDIMASVIPDGHHVDFAAIRIAKAAMKDRLFVITDAVTDTNTGPYQHYLSGDKYEAAGILSGSALTMLKAVQNLIIQADIELGEAIRMCSLYPAKLMGLDGQLGKIEKGYQSALVVMDKNLGLVDTIG